ncbi:hypothetical protein D3273_27835 [Lichenibacterium minor]|uniref:Endonuclease GajA/Old nuclease/RecF-like AAA domain-containing protein n=2 Tax=Lichenibacterium minor TaxID=2316528 RepID=A0A4Q2TYC5_9HYPH|nr:hypothetical protein D3273_27835 [Lichenibacterium minor]
MTGRIQYDGTGVAEALRASFVADTPVVQKVSEWLQRSCDCELSFLNTDRQLIAGRELYEFNLISRKSGTRVSLRDVGEGIAQSLPIVALCHQAAAGILGENAILAMEQPELHLHPRAAVELADEIVACVASGSSATHLIETHSESVLLSVQTAIVKKQIFPEQVIVYWVSQADGNSSLQKISFDDEGYPTGAWPSDVFRETLRQARYLSSLRTGA